MKQEIKLRDLKVFGVIWGIIFAIISYNSQKFSTIAAIISATFLLTAAFYPQIYVRIRFYQNWIKFGNILGKINGFLISAILFYGIFAPVGIILKILKKDLLNKKLNSASSSYFIDRKAQPGDMKNQF